MYYVIVYRMNERTKLFNWWWKFDRLFQQTAQNVATTHHQLFVRRKLKHK